MSRKSTDRDAIVIRPWMGTTFGGEAYAHFDAIVMRREAQPGALSTGTVRYAEYRPLGDYDAPSRTPSRERFRFECQTDDRRPEAYVWTWGYRPEHERILTDNDIIRFSISITRIGQKLRTLDKTQGRATTVGQFVARLARILDLNAIACLEVSPDGSFRDSMAVALEADRTKFGLAIAHIDGIVTDLHRACAERVRRTAA